MVDLIVAAYLEAKNRPAQRAREVRRRSEIARKARRMQRRASRSVSRETTNPKERATMRSQRRKNAPASRESLLRALAHHKLSGIVRSVHEPTESQRRWQIEIIDVGLVEFTDPQVYALCVGLAAGSKGVHRVTQSLESVSEAMCEAATSFSCREAEWIAEAYRAGGHAGIAVEFLAHHAAGDVEGDEHFAGRVLPSECCHSRDFRTFNEDGTQSCRCGVVIGTDGRTIFYPKTLGRMVDEATELHERVLPSTRDVSEYASSAPGWAGEIVGS